LHNDGACKCIAGAAPIVLFSVHERDAPLRTAARPYADPVAISVVVDDGIGHGSVGATLRESLVQLWAAPPSASVVLVRERQS